MGNLIGTIVKGPYLREIDRSLEQPPHERYEKIKNLDMATLGIDLGISKEADRAHIDDEWFGENWWPSAKYPKKEEIVRSAYLEAVKHAYGHEPGTNGDAPSDHKRIVSYWIRGLDIFNAVVIAGEVEVSVFLLTPWPPRPSTPMDAALIDEPIIHIGTAFDVAEIRRQYPAEYQDQLHDPIVYEEDANPDLTVQGQPMMGYGPRGGGN